MKSRVALSFVCMAGAASTSFAAGIYTDHDDISMLLCSNGTSIYNGNFDLVNDAVGDAYDPATENITFALVSFFIADNAFPDGPAKFDINLGPQLIADNSDLTFVYVFAGAVQFNALLVLSTTGQLNYTVEATAGDFNLISATLTGLAEDRPGPPPPNGVSTNGVSTNGVPSGGSTLAMLGLGMLGIGLMQKKLRRI